jgi:hypothetical protein
VAKRYGEADIRAVRRASRVKESEELEGILQGTPAARGGLISVDRPILIPSDPTRILGSLFSFPGDPT